MQLDRFIRGALPLWAAMVCFNCGGSTSHVGTVVPPDSQQTGAGGPAPSLATPEAVARPGQAAAAVRWPAPTSSTTRPCRPTASTSAPTNGRPWSVEFNNLTALESGASFTVYHPVTFHLGRRDGHQRGHQAARAVLLGADRHVRRRAAPRCSSRCRSIRSTPTASSTASASWCSTCRATTGRSCTIASPSTGCGRSACWPPARPTRVSTINGAYYGLYCSRRTSANGS